MQKELNGKDRQLLERLIDDVRTWQNATRQPGMTFVSSGEDLWLQASELEGWLKRVEQGLTIAEEICKLIKQVAEAGQPRC